MAVPGDLRDRLRRQLDALPGIDRVVPVVVLGETAERSNPDTQRRCSLVPVVGQDGQQAIAPGDSDYWELKGGLLAAAIDFDVPTDVEATISWNEDPKLNISDAGGRSGRFEAPDGFLFTIDQIRLTASNNGNQVADVGLWVVVPR